MNLRSGNTQSRSGAIVTAAVMVVLAGCTSQPVPPAPTPEQIASPTPSASPTSAPTTSPVASPVTTSIPSASPPSEQAASLNLEECDALGYIPCEHQAVVLRIPVADTGVAVTYSSEWARGRSERPEEWDAGSLGLGGWSLDVLQRYDSANGILLGGDGRWRSAESLPLADGQTAVPSFDGRRAYVFDAGGRQLRTVDPIIGVDLVSFTYDAEGRLSGAQGSLDSKPIGVTVQRSPDGTVTGLVGVGGSVTQLTLDGAGHLGGLVNPDGSRAGFINDDGGLVVVYEDAGGGVSRFAYDSNGMLQSATDPDGVMLQYSRTTSTDEVVTTLTPSLGPPYVYRVRRTEAGLERSYAAADGTTSTLVVSPDGERRLSYPDGTTMTVGLVADPRWGLAAPILTPTVLERPDGVSLRTEVEQAVEISAADPLHLDAWSRTTTIDGSAYVESYDPASRSLTQTDPLGRVTDVWYDDRGRVTDYSVPGQPAESFVYDALGRLSIHARGVGAAVMTTTYAYGTDGQLTVSYSDGTSETLTYDAAGRVVRDSFDDGSSLINTYDAAGQLIGVRPGAAQGWTVGYGMSGRPTGFVPPAVPDDNTFESTGYDEAGRPVELVGPGDRLISMAYDDAGHLVQLTFDRGPVDVAYDQTTGRAVSVTAPGGVTTRYSYDGPLRAGNAWSGPITGQVDLQFDALGNVVGESVDGGPAIVSSYDSAGMLTGVGPVVLSRDPQTGLLTGARLGTAELGWRYDANGQLSEATATAGGSALLTREYTRDSRGRISAFAEASSSGDHATTYQYDAAGRLATVETDGVQVERSLYDGAGNRISVQAAGSTATSAEYDARNRLSRWANATYEYGAQGAVASATNGSAVTTFDIDDVGALRGVVLPDGRRIDYTVDWPNRRIGRNVDGAAVTGYLYRPDGTVVAQTDGSGTIVARYLYDDGGRLLAILRGDKTYLVATDQLGSPRLVIDTDSGEAVQAVEYDAWGRVTSDSNPGFQPFGFAGGLVDPDSGLLRFGARDYDPTLGRWLEPDPLRFDSGEPNLYVYAGDDPVNRTDPAGLDPLPIAHSCSPESPCNNERWHRDGDHWEVCRPSAGGTQCYPWYGPDPIPGQPPPSGTQWPPDGPPPPGGPGPKSPTGPDPPSGGKSGGFFCLGICSPPGGGMCVGYCSMGDPHIRTADRLSLSFQGAGEYLMIGSANGSIAVQARQEPPGDLTEVTITTAVAASVAGDRVAAYLDDDLRLTVNGETAAGDDVSRALPGGGSVRRNGSSIIVTWSDGSRLSIDRRGAHLDYGFVPDPGVASTLTGLLGTPDGDATNDLISRDGSLTLDPNAPDLFDQLYGAFSDSWRISQQESLFDYQPGESTATFTLPDIPRAQASPAGLSPDVLARAKELCAASGIVREPALSDCVVDVGFTGDSSYAASASAAQASTAGMPPAPNVVQPLILGTAVAGSIVSPNQVDAYSFTAEPGDVVYLQALGPCVEGLSWRLQDANGSQLASQAACADLGSRALAAGGLYQINVFAADEAVGLYAFTAARVPPPTEQTIAIGSQVVDRIAFVGERHRYLFDLTAGQQVMLDAQGDCVEGLSWWFRGPAGESLLSGLTCNDLGPWAVTGDGTYSLEVYSDTTAIGPYSFQLLESP